MNEEKTYTCKQCKTEYRAIRPRLFCNSDCYNEWRHSDEAKNRFRPRAICENCGEEFFADGRFKGHERKFCSKKCSNQYKAKANPYTNWITKTCPTCGDVFQVKQTNKNKIYCSKLCYDKDKLKNVEGRKVGDKIRAQRRRERLTKPIMDNYLLALKIVQKDKCAYCGEPLYGKGTIEHLLPISQGGDNDWWNIVLCCKHCNSQKGTLPLVDYSFKYAKPAIVDKTLFITDLANKLALKLNK